MWAFTHGPLLPGGSSANAYTLTATAGSYALTGSDATLRRALPLAATAGSYAITGADAGLRHTYLLAGAAGSYALTGAAATLTYAQLAAYTLAAEAGAYTITGASAALIYSGAVAEAQSGVSRLRRSRKPSWGDIHLRRDPPQKEEEPKPEPIEEEPDGAPLVLPEHKVDPALAADLALLHDYLTKPELKRLAKIKSRNDDDEIILILKMIAELED